MYESGTPPVGNTIGPVDIILNTPGPGATWSVSGGASMSENINYLVTANTGGTFTGGSYPTPATPGFIWAINQLVLNPSVNIVNFFGGSANSAAITLSFCLNSTSACTSGPNFGSITATFAGVNTPSFTCSFSGCVSGASNTINLKGVVTQIDVTESLSLATFANAGNSVTINNITTNFGQFATSPVPEPRTFWLLCAGLLCIGLGRFRRAGSSK
jgi:hypothetical protein